MNMPVKIISFPLEMNLLFFTYSEFCEYVKLNYVKIIYELEYMSG